MPAVRYPGAIWTPGAAAGYAKGRNAMRTVVCHYTVGYNSAPVGLQGYFHFLVSRGGTVQQFCEVDALAWHAGEWNGTGPGIEVEFYNEPTIFTDAARDACGRLVRWLSPEWGIPQEYYDGPRLNQPHDGFISHRSLIQTEEHNDYWPRADWDAMASAPAPAPEEDDRMKPILILDPAYRINLISPPFAAVFVYDGNNHTKTWLRTPTALQAWQDVAAMSGVPTHIYGTENQAAQRCLADAVELHR